jgi:hypothetical protein
VSSKETEVKELKWADQLADELHKPFVKHFRKR